MANASLPEFERNRLLRRVDWRFLLPDPQPVKSVCFAGGLLARAVEAISLKVVDLDREPAEDCNLAVALEPSADVLRAAAAALLPGGCLYAEWYSSRAGTRRRLCRQLTTAGFDRASWYFAWPAPANGPSAFWLPLKASGACSYFLTHRPRPRSRLRRSKRWIAAQLWRIGAVTGLIRPLCVVARRTGGVASAADSAFSFDADASRPTTQQIHTASVDSAADGIGVDWHTAGTQWLLLTGGQRSINKVVGLRFEQQASVPRLAVKFARVPESTAGLEREATVLEAVHAGRSGGCPSVPYPRFYQSRGDLAVLGETVISGQPLYTSLSRDSYPELAHRGARWLADLVTDQTLLPRAHWWRQVIEPAVARFETCFGAVIDWPLLEASRAALDTLDQLPMTIEQRDFSPWNILLTRSGEFAVLDWESAEPHGLPLTDLTYYLAYLTFFRDSALAAGRHRESYRATLDPRTAVGAVTQDCFTWYLDRVGLSHAVSHPLRLLTWIIHTSSNYQQLKADTGGAPTAERLQESFFLALWEEELLHGGRLPQEPRGSSVERLDQPT